MLAPSGRKLKQHAMEPYTFLRYMGWHGINAKIAGVSGIRLTVLAENLYPMDPGTCMDQFKHRVEQGLPQEETHMSSPTSGSLISELLGMWVHPL